MKLTYRENGRVIARLSADVIVFVPRRKSWISWIMKLWGRL